MARWLTASEIVELCQQEKVAGLPTTDRRMRDLLAREGYAQAPFARKRKGVKRAPLEYCITPKITPLEPLAHRLAVLEEQERKANAVTVVEPKSTALAKRSETEVVRLNARQREVMEARSAVLNAVDLHRVMQDLSERQAIIDVTDKPDFFGLDEALIVSAHGQVKKKSNLSLATVQRWMTLRRDAGLSGLAPKATKKPNELPKWFWDFLSFYARPQKPCITEALDLYLRSDVARRVNEKITYDRVRRLIGKLGNVEKHRGREGSLTLKSRVAYVVRSTADLLPTCVYTADGKTFDAEVAHPITGRPFRPEITSVVDVATRKCVGWSVGLAENSQGVRDALRCSVSIHGICAIFYTDNGAGFKNDDLDNEFTGLLARLGVTKMHSLPYNSQARGIIERFNGSVWNPLARLFDSYFNERMDRQAKMLNFKVTRKDLKEFGTSKKLPSWEEFKAACDAAVEEYNNRPHSALPDRMTPNEYWDWHAANGFEAVTLTKTETDDLFRHWIKRKVRRCLIEINKNTYFNIDLTEFNGDDVLVGMDPHDGHHVWVRRIDETDDGIAPGSLICIARFAGNEERYIPLTLERKAMDARTKARKKRLEEKLDDVIAESRPVLQLEANKAQMVDITPTADELLKPANDFSKSEHAMIELDAEDFEPVEEKKPARKRVFSSDAELAEWAIQHPTELSENQRSVLRECLRSRTDRDLLEQEGINLDELKAVIQSAA